MAVLICFPDFCGSTHQSKLFMLDSSILRITIGTQKFFEPLVLKKIEMVTLIFQNSTFCVGWGGRENEEETSTVETAIYLQRWENHSHKEHLG